MNQYMGKIANIISLRRKNIKLALVIAALSVLLPGYASATASFSSALYRNTFIDMQVKVKSRVLNVKREWKDDHWTFLPELVDLEFEHELVYSEAGTRPEDVYGEAETELVLCQRSLQIDPFCSISN